MYLGTFSRDFGSKHIDPFWISLPEVIPKQPDAVVKWAARGSSNDRTVSIALSGLKIVAVSQHQLVENRNQAYLAGSA